MMVSTILWFMFGFNGMFTVAVLYGLITHQLKDKQDSQLGGYLLFCFFLLNTMCFVHCARALTGG